MLDAGQRFARPGGWATGMCGSRSRITFDVIRKLENQPQTLPTIEYLKKPEIQAAIVKAVEEQHQPTQLNWTG